MICAHMNKSLYLEGPAAGGVIAWHREPTALELGETMAHVGISIEIPNSQFLYTILSMCVLKLMEGKG